jgi:hypothetical protein
MTVLHDTAGWLRGRTTVVGNLGGAQIRDGNHLVT